MALTEIQLPNKEQLYRDLQSIAGEMLSRMLRWREASEFLAKMDTVDLDAVGVPAGQIRTDMTNFRQALNDIIDVFEGNAVTPYMSPEDVMDTIRKMLVM